VLKLALLSSAWIIKAYLLKNQSEKLINIQEFKRRVRIFLQEQEIKVKYHRKRKFEFPTIS